jgi:hypothetical protein
MIKNKLKLRHTLIKKDKDDGNIINLFGIDYSIKDAKNSYGC